MGLSHLSLRYWLLYCSVLCKTMAIVKLSCVSNKRFDMSFWEIRWLPSICTSKHCSIWNLKTSFFLKVTKLNVWAKPRVTDGRLYDFFRYFQHISPVFRRTKFTWKHRDECAPGHSRFNTWLAFRRIKNWVERWPRCRWCERNRPGRWWHDLDHNIWRGIELGW